MKPRDYRQRTRQERSWFTLFYTFVSRPCYRPPVSILTSFAFKSEEVKGV